MINGTLAHTDLIDITSGLYCDDAKQVGRFWCVHRGLHFMGTIARIVVAFGQLAPLDAYPLVLHRIRGSVFLRLVATGPIRGHTSIKLCCAAQQAQSVDPLQDMTQTITNMHFPSHAS